MSYRLLRKARCHFKSCWDSQTDLGLEKKVFISKINSKTVRKLDKSGPESMKNIHA